MNNFEKIKSMDIEEMGDFICSFSDCNCCLCDCEEAELCNTKIIEWLKEEREDKMSDKTILTLILSSIHKRVDVPLDVRFYSFDEVRDLLATVVRTIDIKVFEHIQDLRNGTYESEE